MRTHVLWLLATLAPSADAPAPLAPRLACRSVALTTCKDGFCSTQLVEPGAGEVHMTFDLAGRTYTMSGVKPDPTPMTAVEVEPGAPNHKLFEAKFQIELAHGRHAKVDLIEIENGPLKARATTTFVYSDGMMVVTGYACDRSE